MSFQKSFRSFSRTFITAICLGALAVSPSGFAKKSKVKPPTLTVSVSPASVNEGSVATFTIRASSAATQTLTVNYSMSGTAAIGSDYTLSGATGQATLTAGQTAATIALSARGDGVTPEPNELATMTLLGGSGYKVGTGKKAPKATATIIDVAPPATPVAIAATNVTAAGFRANWSAAGNASGYRLDVATDNGFTNFVPGFQDRDVASVLAFDLTNLNSDTNYFYRVRASNGGGTSNNSNVMAVRTAPVSGYFLPLRGVYTSFERRGYPNGYGNGALIQEFNNFDAVVGSTVAEEIALQLDQIVAMGQNVITFELRTADSTYDPSGYHPPNCNMPPATGLQWPQPTPSEITNLIAFLDLVNSKGVKVWLRLVNNHMEEQPPTNAQTWLGTILNAVKNHPALDLILFEGDRHTDANGACGIPAEPPLWLGATSYAGAYVQWAIDFARGLGIPTNKLSAECVMGDFRTLSQSPAGPEATDGHLWNPIAVEKQIFDALGIPAAERTYALSMYEHHKCTTAPAVPGSVTLSSVADTHLRETNPDNNAGGNTAFASGTNTSGKKSHGVFKFDLSAIPANATVESVTLTLTCVQVPASSVSSIFDLHRLLVDWGEGTGTNVNDAGRLALAGEATWNNRFHPSTAWSAPGAAAPNDYAASISGSTFVDNVGAYTFGSSAAMVDDVKHWVADPSSNFGWLIITESEGTAGTHRLFGSKENATSSARPSLLVQYVTPPGSEGGCSDEDSHAWADETLGQYVFGVVGHSGRVVAPEMGIFDATVTDWNTQRAVESLSNLFAKHGVGGAVFWRWVGFDNSEDSNPEFADAVKRRGTDFVYNPVQKEIVDLGGFHAAVPNRSFENGGATPDQWSASGSGTLARYFLAGEPDQPDFPAQWDPKLGIHVT